MFDIGVLDYNIDLNNNDINSLIYIPVNILNGHYDLFFLKTLLKKKNPPFLYIEIFTKEYREYMYKKFGNEYAKDYLLG